jgi:hypothetical protein
MSGRIGKESNPGSEARPRRPRPQQPKLQQPGTAHPVRFAIQIFIFLLLFSFAARAQSQQVNSTPASDPNLPEAPQIQTESGTLPRPSSDDPSSPASGSIRGVIVDHDGAVYEGVHITLTQSVPIQTPARTATSDTNGRFQFTDVAPGPFQLTISSEGFATEVIQGLLHPGESFEAPAIVLSFATATSEVQVTASQVEVAQAQLRDEEQQRVFGVIPNFYVVYAPNAPPLNPRQKFHLAWRSSVDPITFLATGFFAGIEQASNEFAGYGQGAQGYAKRFGANYADNFIGTMIGGAILPSLLKQDPRYFYKGTGSTRSRILYAIANSVICKGDNGKWQPNYSGLLGGLAAGGISNLYYPASDRNGVTLTFENLGIGIAGSAAQNLFQEFLVRKLTPKLPNYSHSNP